MRSNRDNNFIDSKVFGEVATNFVTNLLLKDKTCIGKISTITNVEMDRKYQPKYIDIIATKDDGVEVPIEVKGDRYPKNVFLEILSNSKTGAQGWLFRTEAKYVFYHFFHLGKIIMLPFPQTLDWYNKNCKNMTYPVRNAINVKSGYYSTGICIPWQEIVMQVSKHGPEKVKVLDCTVLTEQTLAELCAKVHCK